MPASSRERHSVVAFFYLVFSLEGSCFGDSSCLRVSLGSATIHGAYEKLFLEISSARSSFDPLRVLGGDFNEYRFFFSCHCISFNINIHKLQKSQVSNRLDSNQRAPTSKVG